MTIFINSDIAPIRCFADSYVEKYTIQPMLPDGISFDESKGIISGHYSGEAQSIIYTISATNQYNTIQTTIQINYQGICY